MPKPIPYIAVLMAGGQSRRMGRNKGELILNKRPLWRCQLEKLQLLSPDRIYVSVQQKKGWDLPEGVAWLEDETKDAGPMAGLVTALRQAEGQNVLLFALDMAAMTAEGLQAILDRAGEGSGAVGFHNELYEPHAAVYPASALSYAEEVLKTGDRSFQSLLRKLNEAKLMHTFSIDEDRRDLFQSVNTPEAWERFLGSQ